MITVSLEASNKEDWTIQVSATDIETGDAIDFTGASIAFKMVDDCGRAILEATTDEGSITIPTQYVVEIAFTEDQMSAVCAATYKCGCVYLINGVTRQFFVGYAAIYDGIASL